MRAFAHYSAYAETEHVPRISGTRVREVVRATTGQVSINQLALDEFGSTLRGELVRPGDDRYDKRRRVWNASIDRHPALIARCAGVADVIEAVRFARTHELLVAVRGGGHSYPGYGVCDGGMVIELSLMKGIRVDPEARTVRAQAGVLVGELDRETQAFGFAVPAGFISHTGMAGLTLGGGIGFTMRKLGLTIDNLISVDVVTAEGEFIKASEQENADLFWGLRGGGGNFGVATEFEFRLSALGPEIYAGPIFWPIAEARRVLRFYRDWIADCPDELTTLITERKAPATLAGLPAELVGQHVIAVTVIYAGTVREGEKVVRPLKEFGSPALDRCGPMPYLALQEMFNPSFPPGWWYYFRSCDVAGTQRRHHRRHGPVRRTDRFAHHGAGGLANRWCGVSCRRGRDCLQRPGRGPHLQHRRKHHDRRRLRRGARVGPPILDGPSAVSHKCVRQLPHGRGA